MTCRAEKLLLNFYWDRPSRLHGYACAYLIH